MTVPWTEEAGLPVEADDPFTLHFIANDDDDDWGKADDWNRLHAQFQQHGVPYRVIVSPRLPPSEDPYVSDESAWGWITHCNPSFFNR